MKSGHAMQVMCHQKKMEPYPLYNRASARHALDTKSNCGMPNTRANYQMYRKIAPEVHRILVYLPKPASCRTDLTPVLPRDAQTRPFHNKPKIPLPQVAILGVTQRAPQLCSSRLRSPHNFAHTN